MATAYSGRASLVTGPVSSFNSFRLHQFADDVQRSNASTDVQQTPATYSRQLTDVEQMAQAPRPSSGQIPDRMPSIAPSRAMQPDRNQSNSSPSLGALELVELASNPIMEGILGPNKDGRVRNPVPSKLKGKTDNKQGNFGVMHMGMSPGGKKSDAQGKDAAAERDAAARRTSENTASRAKAAQSEKYVPPKKRGLEVSMGDPTASRGSPFAVSREQRARPLAPDETKSEQARLLTLLRSINPVTVVDQICKAVAYFGGIPGAPPPEDGIFPESANTRETGALFIGWLAEIFPDLSAASPEAPRATAGGKKKGAKGKALALGGEGLSSSETPNSRNGYGFGPAISAPAWGLPQSLALVNTPTPALPIPLPEGRQGASSSTEQKSFEHPAATPLKQQLDDNSNSNASANKRRRGRPKGSRNKGRSDGTDGGVNNAQADGHDQIQPSPQSPEVQAAVAKVAQPQQTPSAPSYLPPTPINQPSAVLKRAAAISYPQQPWQISSQQIQGGQADHANAIPPADELSPEERAVLEAFRNQGPDGMNIAPSPIVPAKATPAGGQKRKRATPKPKPVSVPAPSFPPANPMPVQNSNVVPPTNEAPMNLSKDETQWAHVDNPPPNAPPAKKPRQRKPKAAPNINDPPRNNTASIPSATPPMAPSTIPDSQATSSSQQSLPVTRAPAEGLEAHYERFANLSSQQNGRSNTPTVLQQQQQRQQSKPTSIPSQQSTPQMQQQQMQQQKSQQGSQQSNQQSQQTSQRDDHKLTQAATARPSSITYYGQRSQGSTSYSQQYPSHQPSQLYGTHQPSPQMSDNSYRTASSHTLAQASPQFPQSENTYRTASPHTIAQPSPSFSQPDTSYRTNSTHSLAQPSPSYSQAESSYRAPSTHSMAQPASSYTSSRAQSQAQPSHQNQYGHFSDFSSMDLPTLESLGHSGSTSTSNVLSGGSAGWAGQSMGGGLGVPSRTPASRNSLYGTSSSLSNPYDAGTNDLLRGVSRPTSNANPAYGSSSTGMGNTFDTSGTSDRDLRDLLGGLGRR